MLETIFAVAFVVVVVTVCLTGQPNEVGYYTNEDLERIFPKSYKEL